MTKSPDMPEQSDGKRKVGRPSKGKRGNFTFRLTDALREKLAAAAELSDLSMSEEIERRLDQSFSGAGIVSEIFGGPEIARLMNVFAMAAQMVEYETGKKFSEDEVTNLAMKQAFLEIIDLIKTPPADPTRPPMTLASLGNLGTTGPHIDHFGIGRDAAQRSVRITRGAVAKVQAELQEKRGDKKRGGK